MIDEELYQQAADELNSDRRRPHIWARACALASDDHDEARFLYTNLRVEELISERAHGIGSSASTTQDIEDDATLALSPIDDIVDEDEIKGFLDDMEMMDGDSSVPSSVPAPSGIDLPAASDNPLQLEPLNFEEDNANTDETFEAVVDELIEPDADLMSDYVPENHGILDDTYAEEGIAEEDFAKELETFKAEQDTASPLLDTGSFTGAGFAEEKDIDLDSTTNLNLSADDIAEIQDLADAADVDHDMTSVEEAAADLTDLSPLETGAYETPAADMTSGDLTSGDMSSGGMKSGDMTSGDMTSGDMTQANISVLDAQTNELDEMLEDASYQPADTEPPESDSEWLENDSLPTDYEHHENTKRDPTIIEADPYTEELSRQADELDLGEEERPVTEEADFSHLDAQDEDEGVSEPARHHEEDTSDAAIPAAAAASAAALVASAPDLSSPGSHNHRDEVDVDRQELPLDLTQGRKGKSFSVYRRNRHAQAVKTGVSWSALFLTLPYLVYRHMFGTALAYIGLWIVSIGGLAIAGLAWLDAGSDVDPLVQACTIGFALLAFIGLIYIPFRYANSWRGEKLENRGFEMVAVAKAKNPGKAIARARRHAALDS
ncbi:MAG: hypothetical protein AB8B87_01175 [Granulosicoccus sp.]